ncbi:hypothetical protein Unana1_08483 [Umbelopsis nana]
MADSLCFALLRTTTLQILQSAGFESSHLSSADVLTDVFSRYLQLLGQTTAELAEHSGRVKANALDTSTTLSELHIDVGSLRDWIEFGDGKVLTPSWTSGNDPGQILNDVIHSGCHVVDDDDIIQYEYKEVPEDLETRLVDDDASTSSGDDDDEEEVDEADIQQSPNGIDYGKHQSNYIPNHLPPLPIQSLDDDNIPVAQPEPPSSTAVQKQNSPAPKALNSILMKTGKRKAPKEPYRHKIPFEDSYLGNLDIRSAEDTEMQDIHTPSMQDNHKKLSFEKVSKYVEKKTDAGVQATKRHKSWAKSEIAENVNPNRMLTFSDELVSTAPPSMLERIIQNVAPSAAVSKLSSPNLWTDVIASGSNLPEEVITKSTVNGSDVSANVSEKPTPGPSTILNRAKSNSISSEGVTVVHAPLKKAEPVRTAAPTSLAALAASDSTPATPKKSGLTVNLSLSSQSSHSQSTPVSAAPTSADTGTPKIRFKLKLPTVVEPVAPVEVSGDTEVINCICDSPHVDYGAFMIACDQCSEWFHGDCVGIRESDQVAEWFCMRCRPR